MIRVEIPLSDVQFRAWESTARYLDCEGAIRSGKSWMGATKLATLCATHPGIHCLAARWSESDLDAQLKPLWRDIATRYHLDLQWHADEQYDEVVRTGARVYLRGLKASEATSRYAKFRGLTLAHIWIDQAEEVPHDVYVDLLGRLSQPGYPHQIVLTPNPPNESHWIATTFPDEPGACPPDHEYVRFRLHDNAHHLDATTIQALEDIYPEGTAQRRRLIEGRRGLAAQGDSVYRGYFLRSSHVQPVEMDPQIALLEAWDFGHSHPCVVWGQVLPWGELRMLGGVMGHDMFLGDFVPVALRYRAEWCPNPLEVRTTGDPAGEAANNQGVPQRAVDILAEHGIHCRAVPGANHPEKRGWAIQQIASCMRRRTPRGEACTVNPRFVVVSGQGVKQTEVLTDGLEAGYVWDDRAVANTTSPNTRRPKKDGYYDHSQNCLEYLMLAFSWAQPSKIEITKLDARAVRLAQQDTDPYDVRVRQAVGLRSRRGGL